MKRYQSGARVQNWHRPLARSQVRNRFFAERHDIPGVVERGRFVWERYWDCYLDSFYWHDFVVQQWLDWEEESLYEREQRIDETDWNYLRAREVCQEVADQALGLFARGGCCLHASGLTPGDDASSVREETGEAGCLEQRLFDHIELIKSCRTDSQRLLERLLEEGISREDIAVVLGKDFKNAKLDSRAVTLICFAPFWIRSPRTWDGQRRIRGLIQHLFVRYPVPEWLYNAAWWPYCPDIEDMPWDGRKEIAWYLLMAQGGSFRRAAPLFDWDIPKGFQDRLTRVPIECSLEEASMLAEIERLGGGEADFRLVMDNPGMRWDTTHASQAAIFVEFWYATVRWLIQSRQTFSETECKQILDWAVHEFTESLARRQPQLAWQRRGPRAVWQQVEQYDRRRRTPVHVLQRCWKAQGWGWTLSVAPQETWQFHELTSADELQDESNAMSHCVWSYSERCMRGHSVIVSLRLEGERKVTIEIDPLSKRIVQARGARNREATKAELSVILRWVETVLRDRSTGEAVS